MKWAEAVKVWNTHKKSVNPSHVYCLPRKGTPEYDHVKHIQGGGDAASYKKKKAPKNEIVEAKVVKEKKTKAPKKDLKAEIEEKKAQVVEVAKKIKEVSEKIAAKTDHSDKAEKVRAFLKAVIGRRKLIEAMNKSKKLEEKSSNMHDDADMSKKLAELAKKQEADRKKKMESETEKVKNTVIPDHVKPAVEKLKKMMKEGKKGMEINEFFWDHIQKHVEPDVAKKILLELQKAVK
jgi:hypothetical protein